VGDNWSVAEAKARFSELIERAKEDGPQTVTRHGRAAAIIVAPDDWERRTKRAGTLVDFLSASPLRESGLRVERRRDRPRKVRL
jgi:prevent-host-death family protein